MFIVVVATLILIESTIALTLESQCVDHDYAKIRLPRIDLSKYVNGTELEKKEIVRAFGQYMHEFGTLSMFNHQIPTTLMDEMRTSGLNFFKKSEEYKSQYQSNGLGTPGYDPHGTVTAGAAYGMHKYDDDDCDYMQNFAFFNHVSGRDGYDKYLPDKNNAPPELHDISREYISAIRKVLKQVNEMASQALLGFDNTHFFEDIYQKTPHFQLRWLKYNTFNKSEELRKANKFGIAAHKDYLGFTLFRPGEPRGLQNKIGGTDGVWVDCQTGGDLKYDIFVNTGELHDVWTNGYWKANWHRVILGRDPDRITFSFFTGPDQSVIVQPIEGCAVCTQNEPQYMPRTAAQHAQGTFSKGDKGNPNGLKFYSD